MFVLNKYFAWLGIVISAISTVLFPLVRVPISGNWNMYQTDLSLFFVTNGMLALIVVFLFLRNVRWYRYMSLVFAGWCALAFAAVYFKINNYFGMKLVDGLLAKTLHMKWGWFVLFLGAIILLLSVRKLKKVGEPKG